MFPKWLTLATFASAEMVHLASATVAFVSLPRKMALSSHTRIVEISRNDAQDSSSATFAKHKNRNKKSRLVSTQDSVERPMTEVQLGAEVNLDRAKDCAVHFGKCSVKEMEVLKHGTLNCGWC
jgi:hypothetical protein